MVMTSNDAQSPQDTSSQKTEKTNANPSKQVANDQQKSSTAKAQEQNKGKDNETRGLPAEQTSKAPQSESAEEPDTIADEEARATLQAEMNRQGQSGNPYLHSSDGGGRPYNPELDGAPGKEAEAKQAEVDGPATQGPKVSQ